MVCEDPSSSSTTATAAANNKTCNIIPPHFRPQSSAEELTAASYCASGKDRSWSWEEVRAVPPTGTTTDGGGGGSIPGLVMAGGGRSDAEAKEGLLLPRESRTEDYGGDDDGKVGTADTDTDQQDQQQPIKSTSNNCNEGAPSQPAAPPATLSLAERRRLQRESQLAFLRSKGLVPPSSSDATTTSASAGKGGAGASSPAVREGFVVHRCADAAIANLRNNASFGSSDGGTAGGDKAERDAILACPSLDSPASSSAAPGPASAAASAAAAGAASASASAAPYPSFPAYPETMIALSFQLGDRNSTRTGTGTGGGDTTSSNYDPMSSMINGARRAGVAVTGGALVAVGAVLTPLPTPGGILLAGAGLGVLSTEFEGARKVMDKGRDRLVDLIDSFPEEEEEEEKNGDDEDDTCSDSSEKGEEEGRKAENLSASATVAQAAESNRATTTSEGAAASSSASSTSAANNNPKPDSGNIDAAKLKASFRSQVSRLGKSIRPLLADDDAPRRAIDELKIKSERKMGEVKASTNRAYGRMRSHLNEIVDQLALPDDESLGLHDWTTPELMEQEQEQQKKKEQGEGMSFNGTGGATTGAAVAEKEELEDNKSTDDNGAAPAKSEMSNGEVVGSSGTR